MADPSQKLIDFNRGEQLGTLSRCELPTVQVREGERFIRVTGLQLKAMLRVIDDFSRGKGQCFASYETLAKRVGASERTAKRIVAGMLQLGIIAEATRRNGRGGMTLDLRPVWNDLRTIFDPAYRPPHDAASVPQIGAGVPPGQSSVPQIGASVPPVAYKAIGSEELNERKDRSADRDQSPKEIVPGRKQAYREAAEDYQGPQQAIGRRARFNLSGVDWEHVMRMATDVAKRIAPQTEADRRAWLKYAVMADSTFSEAWLLDAAEAVDRAKKTRTTRQRHFVGVLEQAGEELLKAAAEELHVDPATMFRDFFRGIEIPTHIWKSGVLR